MLTKKIQVETDVTIDLDKYALASVIKAVCEQFNTTKEDLLSKRRQAEIILPRHILYYLAYTYTGYSLPKLGSLIDRDHTSLLYAYDKMVNRKRKDKELALLIDQTHLLALVYETKRQKRLTKYREEVQEMIERIKTERLNGL